MIITGKEHRLKYPVAERVSSVDESEFGILSHYMWEIDQGKTQAENPDGLTIGVMRNVVDRQLSSVDDERQIDIHSSETVGDLITVYSWMSFPCTHHSRQKTKE